MRFWPSGPFPWSFPSEVISILHCLGNTMNSTELAGHQSKGVSGGAAFPTGILSKAPHVCLSGPAVILWHLQKCKRKEGAVQEISSQEGPPGKLVCSAAVLRFFMVIDHFENSAGTGVPPQGKISLCTFWGAHRSRNQPDVLAEMPVTSQLSNLANSSEHSKWWSPDL